MKKEDLRVFKIERDYYEIDEEVYTSDEAEFMPGVTVLVGCNGSGKTTLLHQIKHALEKDKIPFYEYDNVMDGGFQSQSLAGYNGDFDFLARAIQSSEGENIRLNLEKIIKKIGQKISYNPDAQEFWILMDAVDSGLSINYIIELKEFFEFIIDMEKNIKLYIIVSTNSYELARGEECFDVRNCMYRTFKDYESYRDFIIESAKIKEERYGNSNE